MRQDRLYRFANINVSANAASCRSYLRAWTKFWQVQSSGPVWHPANSDRSICARSIDITAARSQGSILIVLSAVLTERAVCEATKC
jgi:hypothetical protein